MGLREGEGQPYLENLVPTFCHRSDCSYDHDFGSSRNAPVWRGRCVTSQSNCLLIRSVLCFSFFSLFFRFLFEGPIEWSLRALRFILQARAVIKFVLRAASTSLIFHLRSHPNSNVRLFLIVETKMRYLVRFLINSYIFLSL